MQNNTRTKSMLGTGLIVFSAFIAAMTLVPGAAAHECYGNLPQDCGWCHPEGAFDHHHYFGPSYGPVSPIKYCETDDAGSPVPVGGNGTAGI